MMGLSKKPPTLQKKPPGAMPGIFFAWAKILAIVTTLGAYPPMILPADLEILARTVWGEARSESFEGKVAVAAVVLNRVESKHRSETTVAGAATEPYQFSCWNPNDPNSVILRQITLDDEHFRESYIAALTAMNGEDPTNGATHYHTVKKPRWARSWPPRWAVGKTPSAILGDHVFYSGIR